MSNSPAAERVDGNRRQERGPGQKEQGQEVRIPSSNIRGVFSLGGWGPSKKKNKKNGRRARVHRNQLRTVSDQAIKSADLLNFCYKKSISAFTRTL